jgi:DNA polymerase-3 subunit beta
VSHDVNRKDFLDVLRVVAPRRKEPPILGNVYIEAEGGNVNLTATDLTTFVKGHAHSYGDGTLRALVPAKGLLDFVRNAEGERLRLDIVEGEFVASTPASRWAVPAGDPDEFPEFPKVKEGGTGGWLPAPELLQGLKSVSFAASRDVSRQQLCSVTLKNSRFYASDGKRLAEYDMGLLPGEGLIPIEAVDIFLRFLKYEDYRDVYFDANIDDLTISVRGPSGQVCSRLIEGAFPDYVKYLPTEYSTEATVSVGDLKKAMKAISAGLPKNKRIFTFKIHQGGLCLSSATGEATVPGTSGGAPGRWTFQVEFVTDALKVLGAKEEISFGFRKDKGPAILKWKGLRYVFMPVIV